MLSSSDGSKRAQSGSGSSSSTTRSSRSRSRSRISTRRRTRPAHHDHSIVPLRARPTWSRLDVLPFASAYSALIASDIWLRWHGEEVEDDDDDDYDNGGGYASSSTARAATATAAVAIDTLFCICLVSHVVLFLASRWKTSIRAAVGYARVPSVSAVDCFVTASAPEGAASSEAEAKAAEWMTRWTHVLVTPLGPNSGGADVVPVTVYSTSPSFRRCRRTRGGRQAESEAEAEAEAEAETRTEVVAVADFHNVVFRCTSSGAATVCALRSGKRTGGTAAAAAAMEASRDDEMDGIWGACDNGGGEVQVEVAGDRHNGSSISSSSVGFHRLHFPVDLPLSFYVHSWTGHTTPESLSTARSVYGTNSLPISLPPFARLLADQLVAPFFLFQLFCVVLWSLDEYWYYALFTLMTLVMFECTVSFNRLKALQRLRETLRPPFAVWSYREGRWAQVQSDELVAGDVMSLCCRRQRAKWSAAGAGASAEHDHEGGRHVPADCLLLGGGTAVVDEAALTGESVPQMKEPAESILGALDIDDGGGGNVDGSSGKEGRRGIDGRNGVGGGGAGADVRLDVDDPSHRRSVLFGGTRLVNHCAAPSDEDGLPLPSTGASGVGGAASIPPPPDGGLVVLVLRTGFETAQGSLLRTMVHTSVRGGNNGGGSHGGVDGFDTLVFICLLLLCAVVSSSAVLRHGWNDPTRNRFRLVLHVIIIVTSVVPPELPMELSLAVTSAIADLIQRCGVYCTEPHRIPLAGTVDTCCFDKTGTITSDEMILRGVRLPPYPQRESGGKTATATTMKMDCSDGTDAGGNDDLSLPFAAKGGGDGNGNGAGRHGERDAKDNGGDVDIDADADERLADEKGSIPPETLRVMVACQSLASAGGVAAAGSGVPGSGRRSPATSSAADSFLAGVVGDPLERAVLRSCRWMLLGNDAVMPAPPDPSGGEVGMGFIGAGGGTPVRIWHRYAFTSRLKRMTVLASDVAGPDPHAVWALSKGAPETLKTHLRPDTVPLNYDAVSRRHMSLGQRVLAMGYRNLGRQSAPAGSSPAQRKAAIKEKTKGSWSRLNVEKDLIFAGFLVLDCPLKPDSKKVIRELRESGHECVMITGDAVLTAAEVARSVGIVGGRRKSKGKGKDKAKDKYKASAASSGPEVETYELREVKVTASARTPGSASRSDSRSAGERENRPLSDEPSARFVFVPIDADASDAGSCRPEKCIAYVKPNLPVVKDMLALGEISGICVSGDVLAKISAEAVRRSRAAAAGGSSSSSSSSALPVDDKSALLHPAAQAELRDLVPLLSVFARHAPRQKEAVLAALNGAGRTTLMCGDGTNDVGALKMAHVGVSIVSVPDLEAKQREASEGVERLKEEERRERKRASKKKTKKAESGKTDVKRSTMTMKRERRVTLEKHLRAMAEAEEELAYVNLGDASVASPFTARTMSIRCTCDVLQRGRCTLVTMLQIYKILGVNCLVNALVLTKLHMAGAKQGDRQLTVVGVVVAALFLFVTKGKPLPSLSARRPPSSVLCAQALLSIALQFAVHYLAISAVAALSTAYLDPHDPSLVPDGPFHANVLNTSTFLMTVLATVNTFAVNYRGRPFMEDLGENMFLLRSVQFCYGALFACAAEIFPPLNDLMQLSTLPSGRVEAELFSVFEEGTKGFGGGYFIPPQQVEAVGFKGVLCGLMVVDSVAAFAVERAIVRIFEGPPTTV